MLAGMMARPRATSSRTNSGVQKSGISAPKPRRPDEGVAFLAAQVLADGDVFHLGVMIPRRAYSSWVTLAPALAR
jgi:hypothetical protein